MGLVLLATALASAEGWIAQRLHAPVGRIDPVTSASSPRPPFASHQHAGLRPPLPSVHALAMVIDTDAHSTAWPCAESVRRAVPPRLDMRSARESSTKLLSTAASLGSIITVDVALRRLFAARAVPFPSSLAGMLGLFGALCTIQAIRPQAAAAVADAAAPGCAFISRWLALFFVPNLVLLPLVLQMTAMDAAKLLALVVVGLSASLPLAAFAAKAALGDQQDSSPAITSTRAAAAPGTTTAAAAAPSPLPRLVGATVVSGCAAIIAHRLSGAATVLSAALANLHLLTCTVVGFLGGQQLVPKPTQKILHPLITCTLFTQLAIALYAAVTAQPLAATLRSYLLAGGAPLASPGNLLLFMLGPATLSFGFQMFGRRQLMRQSAKAVSVVTAISASFGLFATAVAGRILRLPLPVRLAAIPRQVTAPLAIAIAGMLQANPSLAATIVVITGLLAANFGRAALDALGITSPVARGLAMGAAGHGLGTAAMAEEREAFPFAAIAMALNAALSTVLVSVPAVRTALLAAAGAGAI